MPWLHLANSNRTLISTATEFPKEQLMVLINAWAIGRDATVWDSPEEFRPERFIDGEARDINFISHGFQLLAFGAGRRSCPGTQFSVALVEHAIANLVYAFDWRPAKGRVEDIDMGEASGLITRRREPLLLVATKATKGPFRTVATV